MAKIEFKFEPITAGDEIVLGNKALIQADLLWTNASPTSSFASQAISLDLSKYTYVYIMARWFPSDAQQMSTITRIGESGLLFSEYNTRVFRPFTVANDKVNFAAGQSGAVGGQAGTNNTAAIPQVIYGIK